MGQPEYLVRTAAHVHQHHQLITAGATAWLAHVAWKFGPAGPRRFAAGALLLLALTVARRAADMLGDDSPTRTFVHGHLDRFPLGWRDLPKFASHRRQRAA